MVNPAFNRRAIPVGARFAESRTRDGWPLRWFDWPVDGQTPVRGSILFQCGRGDIVEKYLETLAHWHAAGWHVSSFDWRGQGGSGRLAADPRIGHIADFAIWIDDLAENWSAWRNRTPGPHVVIGHSMGGHLVLRALLEKRIDPVAAVLVAPMLGFEAGKLPVNWLGALVNKLAMLWPERRAWKENERPTAASTRRQSFLTHDDLRYADEIWWKVTQPELDMGPPSLSWLAQAYASTKNMEADDRLEQITTPILLLGTQGDKLVSPAAIPRIAARLPNATLKMYDQTVSHEILREIDSVRDDALAMIEAFLREQVAHDF
jgi:lysophospholipase